jgi:hypothetical protein
MGYDADKGAREILRSLAAVSTARVRQLDRSLKEPAIAGLRAFSDFYLLHWQDEDEGDELAKIRRAGRRLRRTIRVYERDFDSVDREDEESEEDDHNDLMAEVRRLQRLPKHRELQERVLSLLRFGLYRDWSRSHIAPLFKQAVAWAADDGDQKFFKALGERLKEKPITLKAPRERSPLQEILIDHWSVPKGICLCWFSDKALQSFLALTDKTYTQDAIRKARTRLRLRKLGRPLVRAVEKLGPNQIRLR